MTSGRSSAQIREVKDFVIRSTPNAVSQLSGF
jgi:hypothetical protein